MIQLRDIKSELQNLAFTMAPVLGVEVGFVDGDCYNIAGTGPFQKEQGYNYPFPSLTTQIMESKQELLMKSRSASPSCRRCPYQDSCEIVSSLAIPIKFIERVIGLWAFIAYDRSQADRLMEKHVMLSKMASQLSEMLVYGLLHHHLDTKNNIFFDYLQKVLDLSSKGLMVVDLSSSMVVSNEKARQQVGKRIKTFGPKLLSQTFSRSELLSELLQDKPFFFQQAIGKQVFSGTLWPLIVSKEVQGAVISLGDAVKGSQERGFMEMTGQNPAILKLKEKALTLAATDVTILLLGETGTGKELLARTIHNLSCQKRGSFIAVNCGAIPENLLEAELFGYEKGAFTGSRPEGKPGILEEAQGGTVFLDEIADLPLSLQVKILRVLEERQIRRVGGLRLIPLNVRFLAATNRNLRELVAKGHFREDLYWRLNVVSLTIPPLRERPEDILFLAKFFLEKYSFTLNKKFIGFMPECDKLFLSYGWPGNVRELQSVVYHAAIMENSPFVTPASLPEYLLQSNEDQNKGVNLEDIEKTAIARALTKHGWSKKGKENAARELGIGIASLYRKIKKYGLKKPSQGPVPNC
ncbi:MAG: hypothetical protein C4554_07520 [Dethiobacter sp.]|jgi:transcriptional regulator with PAS, ATPase and Fis domain|nr:MAG: hypothetical protein C4554_07520 [Dethiobacter sp.]